MTQARSPEHDASTTTRIDIERVDAPTIAAASKLPTPTLHEGAGKIGALPPAIKPVARGMRICGPALTIHSPPGDNLWLHRALAIAKPGDVLVVEGVTGCSNMGGLSATTGRRQGEIGAIIDGSVRDPDAYARLGWPVWCRGYTPITGKWRLETIEINGTVQVGGVQCSPGDLVCADAAGIAIIPRARVEEVLTLSEKFDKGDAKRQADIESGVSMHEMTGKSYK